MTQTSLNLLPARAAGRSPRGMVKLNGQPVSAWAEWKIDNNCHYQADTFRVTLAANGLPKATDAAWLTGQADLSVELLAGLPADPANFGEGQLTSYITGRVDDVQYDPEQNTIELSGRDYTSQFLDVKTTEKFQNQTASQIAQTLAKRHNMACDTVPTSARAGAFYQIDHARLTNERTEWDLLTWLAGECQYDVYVTGRTLHFLPRADPAGSRKYRIAWTAPAAQGGFAQCNATRLRFARNLTLARDVKVVVRYGSVKAKTWPCPVVVTASHNKNRVARNARIPYGQTQTFTYALAGKTHQEALAWANARLADISRHEMRLEAVLPGDDVLSARTLVEVVGTGTAFDQVYYPESVIRRMSLRDGYLMELRAKNHSPETTVGL